MFVTKEGKLQSDEPVTYETITRKSKKRQRKQFKKHKSKHPIIKGIFKIILVLFLLAMILIFSVSGYVYYKLKDIVKDVKLSKNDLVIKNENSIIKDIKGNEIGVLNGEENRVIITMADMAKYLPRAFIAIEDERFYEHKGVDIKRTVGATYTYLKNDGKSSFGGSTITQQLVKNLTQENEETWQRKVREMARAYYVEQEMSKDEILELYLNLIFLGDTIYGVEQGSNYYFNKPAKDLSLAECAFLAGINHSPNAYNPFVKNNKEVLKSIKSRTKIVLNKMRELGYIDTDKDYNIAIKEVENGLKFNKGAKPQVIFSYHTDAAINQIVRRLQKENGWTYNQAKLYLSGGGFTIYTTEDPEKTAILEEELAQEKYHRADYDDNGNLQETQAAIVLIDNNTGYVVAIANGFNKEKTAFGFNIATDAKKQTGSSMKPIAVLAPSIDKGIITAATIFDDNPTSFDNGAYEPKDYNNYYRGLIPVREAIAHSQNIPMVKTMCLLTPQESIKFLNNVGITTIDNEKDNVLPLALGGLYNGITPLEMAGAYATIANDGKYREPLFYTKIVDSEGNTVLEADLTEKQVMSPEAAYVVKEVLTETVKTGTSTTCKIDNMDVATKTGTTNNDYDRWLCGFTPYYTATVWYGHDTNATVKGWDLNPASQIWTAVMKRLHEGLEPKTFYETKPEGVVETVVCKKSGFLATSSCKYSGCAYTEYFVSGTEPIQTCPYHSSAKICTESGLLATENCPHKRSVYGSGEYIDSKGLWQTKSGYYKPKNIPLERCNIH